MFSLSCLSFFFLLIATAVAAIVAATAVAVAAIAAICLPLPSLPEQQQIGEFFKKIDQQIQLNQNKLEDMKQMKKGLMQRMFV